MSTDLRQAPLLRDQLGLGLRPPQDIRAAAMLLRAAVILIFALFIGPGLGSAATLGGPLLCFTGQTAWELSAVGEPTGGASCDACLACAVAAAPTPPTPTARRVSSDPRLLGARAVAETPARPQARGYRVRAPPRA